MQSRPWKRRQFITLLGGAAATSAAGSLATQAQAQELTVVGFLNHGSPPSAATLAAFRKGLSESGYVDGRNVTIDFRWAQFDNDRLTEFAADLVRRRVGVIATAVSTPASLAAKAATTTIPIVFGIGGDPVEAGLVASFNRPGGNVTGVSGMNWELTAKRLGLLHELLPKAGGFAGLVNPKDPNAELFVRDLNVTAAAIGRKIEVLRAGTPHDIDVAYASFVKSRADALLIAPDAAFFARRVQLIGLSLRHVVPAIYPWREAIEIGGLMSYGSSFPEIFREVGMYTGRILKGERPVDLPVLRASKFEFVINLQTARTLGLGIPPTLLALADEVIE